MQPLARFGPSISAMAAAARRAALSTTALAASPSTPTTTSASGPKLSGKLGNLIYGNQEALTKVDQAHSKLLARDESVMELQFHHVKPDALEDYIGYSTELYKALEESSGDSKAPISHIGSFMIQIGEQDTAVHMTSYHDPSVYEMTKASQDDRARDLERKLRGTIQYRTNHLCREFNFWNPVPIHDDGIYELRSYTIKPGAMLEWAHHWAKGVEARRQHCHPIGAWFSQIGKLNTVHHLWYYQNMQERKEAREQAWQVKGWSDTVWHTVPLVTQHTTNIMRRLF